MCGQKCQEGLLIRLYSLSLLLCFSLSLSCPYPLSFLTSSPHLPSSSTPEAGGHQPGAAFAVGLKERRQRMRPGLRSVSHTHSLSFGGRPCHYITPPLSSVLHSKPPLEGCPCYYNTLSLRLGSQYVSMPRGTVPRRVMLRR